MEVGILFSYQEAETDQFTAVYQKISLLKN